MYAHAYLLNPFTDFWKCIAYFIRKTTYSNRKLPYRALVNTLLLIIIFYFINTCCLNIKYQIFVLDIGIEISTPNTKCINYVCRIVEEVIISPSCLHLQVALENIIELVLFAMCIHIYIYIYSPYMCLANYLCIYIMVLDIYVHIYSPSHIVSSWQGIAHLTCPSAWSVARSPLISHVWCWSSLLGAGGCCGWCHQSTRGSSKIMMQRKHVATGSTITGSCGRRLLITKASPTTSTCERQPSRRILAQPKQSIHTDS